MPIFTTAPDEDMGICLLCGERGVLVESANLPEGWEGVSCMTCAAFYDDEEDERANREYE